MSLIEQGREWQIIWRPEGFGVGAPTKEGYDLPNQIGRRNLPIGDHQAMQLHFAHSLASEAVSVSLLALDRASGNWYVVIPPTGTDVAPYTPQHSPWVAIPRSLGFNVDLRFLVYGDGTLQPRFTYLTLEVR